jgi:hypothetical protein
MSAADPVAKQLHDLLADWHSRNANLVPMGRVDADLHNRVGEVLRDVVRRWNDLSLAGVTDERRYIDLHEPSTQNYIDLLDELDGKRPTGKTRSDNLLERTGQVWRVCYKDQDEAGDFPDRKNSAFRHLARLLAEPHQRFGALEFYPPPPGATPPPHYGRDATSDDQAIEDYEKEMRRLSDEIKEAVDAHDTETASRLRARFDTLKQHLDGEMGARNRRHKKRCGALSPKEKADQTLRMGLKNLKARLRKEGLPKLAAHLDKYIDNGGCEWRYAPPPGTLPWRITGIDVLHEE